MEYVYLGLFESIFNWVLKNIFDPVFSFVSNLLTTVLSWIFQEILAPILIPILKQALEFFINLWKELYSTQLYLLFSGLLKLIDYLEKAFDVFIGLEPVTYKDTNGRTITGTLVEVLMQQKTVSTVFWIITLGALGIALVLTIYATAKSAFDLDFENKRPVSKVLAAMMKTFIQFFTVPFFVYFFLQLSSTILQGVTRLFQLGQETTLGRTVFVIASLNAAKNSSFNLTKSNGSITLGISPEDTIRYPFYSLSGGAKDYANLEQVKELFFLASFDYIIGFIAAVFLLFTLGVCLIIFIQRVFEILLLYMVSPYFVCMMPLDDGEKFSRWREMFVAKCFTGFGSVVGMRLFLMICPLIMGNRIRFGTATSPEMDYMMKLFFLVGGAWAVYKSGPMITSLLSSQAGSTEANTAAMAGGMIYSYTAGKLISKGQQAMHSALNKIGKSEKDSAGKEGKNNNDKFNGKKDNDNSVMRSSQIGNAGKSGTGGSAGTSLDVSGSASASRGVGGSASASRGVGGSASASRGVGGSAGASRGVGGSASASRGVGGSASASRGVGGSAGASSGAGGSAGASRGVGGSAGASSGVGRSAGASSGAGGSASASSGAGRSAGASSGAGGSAGASSGVGRSAGASSGADGSAGASSGVGRSAGASSGAGGSASASNGVGRSAGASRGVGGSAGASSGAGGSAGASSGVGRSAGASSSAGGTTSSGNQEGSFTGKTSQEMSSIGSAGSKPGIHSSGQKKESGKGSGINVKLNDQIGKLPESSGNPNDAATRFKGSGNSVNRQHSSSHAVNQNGNQKSDGAYQGKKQNENYRLNMRGSRYTISSGGDVISRRFPGSVLNGENKLNLTRVGGLDDIADRLNNKANTDNADGRFTGIKTESFDAGSESSISSSYSSESSTDAGSTNEAYSGSSSSGYSDSSSTDSYSSISDSSSSSADSYSGTSDSSSSADSYSGTSDSSSSSAGSYSSTSDSSSSSAGSYSSTSDSSSSAGSYSSTSGSSRGSAGSYSSTSGSSRGSAGSYSSTSGSSRGSAGSYSSTSGSSRGSAGSYSNISGKTNHYTSSAAGTRSQNTMKSGMGGSGRNYTSSLGNLGSAGSSGGVRGTGRGSSTAAATYQVSSAPIPAVRRVNSSNSNVKVKYSDISIKGLQHKGQQGGRPFSRRNGK